MCRKVTGGTREGLEGLPDRLEEGEEEGEGLREVEEGEEAVLLPGLELPGSRDQGSCTIEAA